MHPEEYKKCLEGSGKAAQQELEAVEQGAGQPPAPPPHSRAPPSRYLRTKAAAAYLKLSTSTLAKMRLRGDGPPPPCAPLVVRLASWFSFPDGVDAGTLRVPNGKVRESWDHHGHHQDHLHGHAHAV